MKISIYIPSFNQKTYLAEAIESVLAQTLRPHQVILVDDCSDDGSQELIELYAARYPDLITTILHDTNQGISRSRVDALLAVTGDYVTYVDGDDRLLPTKLERESKLLKANPQADIAFSNYHLIDAEGTRFRLWADGEQPPEGDVFRQVFLREYPRTSLFRCELVRYEALREAGFYDTRINLYEDWELRIRLTKQFHTVYCDEPLSEYRRHGNGLSDVQLDEHVAAWQCIWQKNRHLLQDVEPSQRAEIESGYEDLILDLRRRAARQQSRRRISESVGTVTWMSRFRKRLRNLTRAAS